MPGAGQEGLLHFARQMQQPLPCTHVYSSLHIHSELLTLHVLTCLPIRMAIPICIWGCSACINSPTAQHAVLQMSVHDCVQCQVYCCNVQSLLLVVICGSVA